VDKENIHQIVKHLWSKYKIQTFQKIYLKKLNLLHSVLEILLMFISTRLLKMLKMPSQDLEQQLSLKLDMEMTNMKKNMKPFIMIGHQIVSLILVSHHHQIFYYHHNMD